MTRTVLFFAAASVAALSALPSAAQAVSYRAPLLNGQPIDYCGYHFGQCGAGAADAFCKGEGHLRADSYTRRPVRADEPPTIPVVDNFSGGLSGDSFAEIECVPTVDRGRTPYTPGDDPQNPGDDDRGGRGQTASAGQNSTF